MFLSVLLKSFSQIAQKSRRRPVGAISTFSEQCEERRLLSATPVRLSSAIPNAPPGQSSPAAPVGTVMPLTNLPQLNSLAGAPVSVILKFDGYTDNDPGWISFRDSGSGPIVTPAFDLDGDATTFNTEELRQIEEIWYRVAEDFAPFNINVTTIAPPVLNDFEHVMAVIGGDGDWAPPAGGWGIYGFTNSAANTNYVFSELFFNPHQIASVSTHESGHTLGLAHQSTYDTNGVKVDEYNPGDANSAPLMGVGYYTMRDTWWLGPNSASATTIQNDLTELTSAQNQTVRFRNDDHGNSVASATPIVVSSANVSARGIIERNNDSDFFQFTTDDGPVSFNAEGLNLRRIYSDNSLTYGTNLDAVLRLYDSTGTLLAQSNPANSLFANVSANVTAGIYYLEVTHTGQFGSIGQFNLTGTVTPLETFSLTVNRSSVFETAGDRAATGTVTRSDFANIANPVVVTLKSSDISELTVPATVTIPAGSRTATFFIKAVDDALADGTQRVDITGTATLGGQLRTGVASINVLDVETLTLTINKTTVSESAGKGAAQITVTRSNTDTAAPNTFSVVNNQLLEHSPTGTLVRSRTIPWPTGTRPAGEIARDVVVMENSRIAVHNGTRIGYLSILNPATNSWQHILLPGLSSEASVTGSGGISSTGDYVFLSDMSSSSSDPFGVVRVDTISGAVTRFAEESLGYRMFVKDIFSTSIIEIDLKTGATINTIPMPSLSSNVGFNNGLAFDGTSLWVLAGPTDNNIFYKLNPDTGAILEVHGVFTTGEWDGLAWLNGQLYLLNNVTNQITIYDPILRRVTNTLNVGVTNNINIGGGLAAITGPDRLIATSASGDFIYEINPVNGVVTNQWRSGMSTTEYGVGTANGEIYIGEFIGGELRVFNRSGILQRVLDVDLSGSEGVFAIGGDDIKTLVPTDYRYRDNYSGLDGKFYVLDKAGIAVGRFDPATLALEEFFNLAKPVNAIAVAADGTIWGAGGDGVLYHFSGTGTVLGQRTIGSVTLVDIDLNVSGQILLTSSAGRVYKTSTSLATPTSFSAGTSLAYASLGRHQSQPAGDLIVQLTNSDPTEISIPSSVVIPVGQRSVTVPLDALPDQILDGSQIVTITASAIGYTGTPSRKITVTDGEFIVVDILAAEISEAAGKNATQARLTRSNVNGPFTYLSKQSFSNSSSQTILDFDKTLSQITVPSQTSQLTDVNVTLSLSHSFLADLDIFLVSPKGTRVELVTDIISNETEMTNTTFDDNANNLILDASRVAQDTSAIFTGRFRPEGRLLDLNGENPSGRWTLEITDDNVTDFGTLLSWSMNIETKGLAPQTVTLTRTDDTNEIFAPTTAVIPANQTSVLVPIDAVDDRLLDGTRTSGLRSSTTTGGYLTGADTVRVTDSETLTLTVNKTTVSEAAGIGALIGTLTRSNTDISSGFTVNLSSNDPTELTVPFNVTIPAGRSSVNFPINAVDDNIHDGSRTVSIRASAAAYGADKTLVITVEDLEPSLKVSSATTRVREDVGTIAVTFTRQDQVDLSRPLLVNLAVADISNGSSPLIVPASVTIPVNRDSITVSVKVNNDSVLDGTQTASIRATGTGITGGSALFTITDHETLSVTFDDKSIREDLGAKAARGTVHRSNVNLALPLVVKLTSGDLSEVRVPSQVTIPAGATSVSFDVEAVNDSFVDGTQTVTISAVAAGYVTGTARIAVGDHEPPVLIGPSAVVATSLPAVTWRAVAGALRYDVYLQNLSTGGQQLYPGLPATKTSFTRSEPLGIGRYRVYVRAVDQLERAGFWSIARDFRVETAPKITSPVIRAGVGGVFPEIAWSAVIDASGYELLVHNQTTGQKNLISEKNLRTTSYRDVAGLGSGTYSAQVRAFNSKNEYGQWSPAHVFTVLGAPAIVSPVSGGTFDRIPNIQWTAVAGATSYDVYLSKRSTGEIVFRDQFVTETSVRVPRDLVDGDYRVSVQAQFGKYFGSWSAGRFFSVGASPAITAPVKGASVGEKPKFVWTGISGSERYELHVMNLDTKVVVLAATNVTSTSYTMNSALALGLYRVQVRAVSTMGEKTAWSQPVDFMGGATPGITSPAPGVRTVSKPLISWTGVSGATSYQVWIQDQTTQKGILTASKVTSTTYTVTTNLNSGRYRVWVRAVSATGRLSAWSEPVSFTVASTPESDDLQSSDRNDLLASSLIFEMVTPANDTVSVQSQSVSGQGDVAFTEDSLAVEHQALDAAHDVVMAGWDASEWWAVKQSAVGETESPVGVPPVVARGRKTAKI